MKLRNLKSNFNIKLEFHKWNLKCLFVLDSYYLTIFNQTIFRNTNFLLITLLKIDFLFYFLIIL